MGADGGGGASLELEQSTRSPGAAKWTIKQTINKNRRRKKRKKKEKKKKEKKGKMDAAWGGF